MLVNLAALFGYLTSCEKILAQGSRLPSMEPAVLTLSGISVTGATDGSTVSLSIATWLRLGGVALHFGACHSQTARPPAGHGLLTYGHAALLGRVAAPLHPAALVSAPHRPPSMPARLLDGAVAVDAARWSSGSSAPQLAAAAGASGRPVTALSGTGFSGTGPPFTHIHTQRFVEIDQLLEFEEGSFMPAQLPCPSDRAPPSSTTIV